MDTCPTKGLVEVVTALSSYLRTPCLILEDFQSVMMIKHWAKHLFILFTNIAQPDDTSQYDVHCLERNTGNLVNLAIYCSNHFITKLIVVTIECHSS